MNNEKEATIKRLNFENFIWVIFIIISILDIYGDELIKKSIRENDVNSDLKAKKIFTIILYVSILAYIYFLIRNYYDYKKHPQSDLYYIRLFGSILVLTGSICFLYFQIKSTRVTSSPSNV